MIWAIVPAKTLEQAKTRLARVLSPEERRALSGNHIIGKKDAARQILRAL